MRNKGKRCYLKASNQAQPRQVATDNRYPRGLAGCCVKEFVTLVLVFSHFCLYDSAIYHIPERPGTALI